MENETEKSQADIDWDNRILCSDDNCIGVIGTDGRCKECGRLFDGDLPVAAPQKEIDTKETQTVPADRLETVAEAGNPEEKSAPATRDEWENRRLCIDGNCIGIIGPDGNCKECGLAYKP